MGFHLVLLSLVCTFRRYYNSKPQVLSSYSLFKVFGGVLQSTEGTSACPKLANKSNITQLRLTLLCPRAIELWSAGSFFMFVSIG